MKNFIQEAMKEIEHVTWPTKAETKKYFTIVTSMIIIWAIILAVFGFLVTEAMFTVRKWTPHETAAPVTTAEDVQSLDSLLTKDEATVSGNAEPKATEKNSPSVATQSGTTATSSGSNN